MEDKEPNNTPTSLQKLINEKAEARLKQDLKGLLAIVSQHPLLRGKGGYSPDVCLVIEEEEGKPVKYSKPLNLSSLLNENFGLLYQRMYNNYLDVYIQEETQAFMNKVDELQESVQDLMNNKQDREDY